MGRLSAALLAVVLGAVAALGLVACGGGDKADLLPGETASEITANLDEVQALVGEGECVGAEDAAQEVSAQVGALEGVDAKLEQALREGATRLNEVVASCVEAPAEEATEPAIETAVEPEAEEKEKKKEKADEPGGPKPGEEAEEAPEETTPALPPQAEGKAKGQEEEGGEEAPPVESESGGTAAGGIGPSTPAGSE